MKLGYIRLSKAAPGLKEQQDAMRGVGMTDFSSDGPVYVDQEPKGRRRGPGGLDQRAEVIKALRRGDELVVASAARLGTSTEDMMGVLAAIGAAGATVFDIAAGRAFTWHPDATDALAFIAAAEKERRQEVTAKARRRAAELGAVRGQAKKLTGKKLAAAKTDWASVELTAAEVSTKHGVPVRTLYRLFGPRGTPIFGGGKGG